MRVRPAQQEKTKAKTKPATKREQSSAPRTSRKVEAKGSAAATPKAASIEEPQEEAVQTSPTAPSLLVPAPNFVRRDITLPDGTVRPGWEMWIGDHCFGRADSKELLLASFERLQSPPESFHWREVRNRMPMRGRPRPAVQPQEEKDEPWGWGKKEEEPLLEAEEAEGFQELSWETPS